MNCHLTLGRIKGHAFGLGGWAEFPDSLHVPAAVLEKRTRSPEYDSRPLCRPLTIAGKNSLSLKGYPSTFIIDGKRAVTFAKISKSHGGRAKAEEVLKVLTGSLDRTVG